MKGPFKLVDVSNRNTHIVADERAATEFCATHKGPGAYPYRQAVPVRDRQRIAFTCDKADIAIKHAYTANEHFKVPVAVIKRNDELFEVVIDIFEPDYLAVADSIHGFAIAEKCMTQVTAPSDFRDDKSAHLSYRAFSCVRDQVVFVDAHENLLEALSPIQKPTLLLLDVPTVVVTLGKRGPQEFREFYRYETAAEYVGKNARDYTIMTPVDMRQRISFLTMAMEDDLRLLQGYARVHFGAASYCVKAYGFWDEVIIDKFVDGEQQVHAAVEEFIARLPELKFVKSSGAVIHKIRHNYPCAPAFTRGHIPMVNDKPEFDQSKLQFVALNHAVDGALGPAPASTAAPTPAVAPTPTFTSTLTVVQSTPTPTPTSAPVVAPTPTAAPAVVPAPTPTPAPPQPAPQVLDSGSAAPSPPARDAVYFVTDINQQYVKVFKVSHGCTYA